LGGPLGYPPEDLIGGRVRLGGDELAPASLSETGDEVPAGGDVSSPAGAEVHDLGLPEPRVGGRQQTRGQLLARDEQVWALTEWMFDEREPGGPRSGELVERNAFLVVERVEVEGHGIERGHQVARLEEQSDGLNLLAVPNPHRRDDTTSLLHRNRPPDSALLAGMIAGLGCNTLGFSRRARHHRLRTGRLARIKADRRLEANQ